MTTMEKQIQKFLYNTTVGKIVTIFIGVAIIWLIIKALQRSLFSNIRDKDNSYSAKKYCSSIGYFPLLILLTVVSSDNLGGLTVALVVAGAGIAFVLYEVIASFAGWLAIMFGGFYKTGDGVHLVEIKGDLMYM